MIINVASHTAHSLIDEAVEQMEPALMHVREWATATGCTVTAVQWHSTSPTTLEQPDTDYTLGVTITDDWQCPVTVELIVTIVSDVSARITVVQGAAS